MDVLACAAAGLCDGDHADQSVMVPGRRDARHRDRYSARHRSGAHHRPAPADHRQARSDRRLHHVCRPLLRRDVWQLDHLDPAQHAGRIGLDHHRGRGQSHGQARARRGSACNCRHRFLRCRHARHSRASPFWRPLFVKLALLFGPAEYFALDGAGLHHRFGAARGCRCRAASPASCSASR